MQLRVLVGLSAVIFLGCGRENAPTTEAASHPSALRLSEPSANALPVRPCDMTKEFFVGTAIADREDWYGAHLSALGEPVLCGEEGTEQRIIRLTWLPSFHPSVVVRVERLSTGYRLEAKIESGAGGYEPGHLARDTVITLSVTDGAEFERLLAAAHFWGLPTVPAPDGTVGLDGAQWVIEGLSDGRYHVVDRWTPDRNGPAADFRKLAEWLLAKSDLVAAELVREY
jgi:hypothetical protein